MQKYINQLISDLELIASQKLQEAYIEIPPQIEESADISELALVPFKPISQWTGMNAEVFPQVWQLSYEQCKQVNRAIFKVYENLKLDLIDKPKDIPEDCLYDVLSSNWDHYVQYLPLSGMDLELCSSNWRTCTYGEYCDFCGEEFLKKQEEGDQLINDNSF